MTLTDIAKVLCHVAATRHRDGCNREPVVRWLAEAATQRCVPVPAPAEVTRLLYDPGIHR